MSRKDDDLKLDNELNSWQEQLDKLIRETDLDDNDIYSCLKCRDCGWIIEDGVASPCSCRQQARERKLLDIPHLREMSFAGFDLKLYPENIKTERGKSYRQIAREALDEAISFAAGIARGANRPGLIFEGDVGSGKTFLAAAIANELLSHGVDVDFVVVPEFLDELRRNIHNEGNDGGAAEERAKECAVLVLDDMGAHNFSPWVQNVLFTIINYRLNHQLPMIITTNLSVDELAETVGLRIVSRLMEIGANVKLFIDKDIRLKLYRGERNSW